MSSERYRDNRFIDEEEQSEDPLESIRENEEAVEALAEEDSQKGAVARYLLAVSRGEAPDPVDCLEADLPDPRGEWR